MRLRDKVAIVVGAGQKAGLTMGNGRAVALLFGRQGARVLALDSNLASAEETAALIVQGGGEASALAADVTDEASIQGAMAAAVTRWGALDILHYNVGVSLAAGDAPVTEITASAFDRVVAINLRGMVLCCKHALPVMRRQGSGVILAISSISAWADYPYVAYKATKVGLIALTQQLALQNARYGIRANVILPGLIDTPMAVDTRVEKLQRSREEIVAERDARVPLRGKMGTAWDVAYASLFLASDEANFITGVALPVDGGQSVNLK